MIRGGCVGRGDVNGRTDSNFTSGEGSAYGRDHSIFIRWFISNLGGTPLPTQTSSPHQELHHPQPQRDLLATRLSVPPWPPLSQVALARTPDTPNPHPSDIAGFVSTACSACSASYKRGHSREGVWVWEMESQGSESHRRRKGRKEDEASRRGRQEAVGGEERGAKEWAGLSSRRSRRRIDS